MAKNNEHDKLDVRSIAKNVLDLEITGLKALKENIGDSFAALVTLCENTTGRIVVTGVGKSGHIARKISSTLASTGTPSLFLHPTEASHGDLGMIGNNDAILALSKSGETSELGDLLSYAARFGIPIAAITFEAKSTLADQATVTLALPSAAEACGETRAPTTSTTMMMAAGDALAVALLRLKGFTANDFHNFHPGGNLGAALRRVKDLMHGEAVIPLSPENARLEDVVGILENGGFGCVGLVNQSGDLTGILTDGDLRRRFGQITKDTIAAKIMTRTPKIVSPETLAGDALALLSRGKITALFVVENKKPVGLLHVHDCLSTGIL